MADRSYSVVRAFNSVAGDGSGEERYFTAGNQHELEGFVSAEELQYRIEEGYVMVEDHFELPEKVFVHPRDAEAAAPVAEAEAPVRRPRRGRAATTEE